MVKKIMFLLSGVLCSLCFAKDNQYYRLHPAELQKNLSYCPKQVDADFNCDDLNELAKSVNAMSYELQMNPQGFGQTILKLEETIILQEAALKKDKHDKILEASLIKNKEDLASRLALVKWLESP